jgi:hypothetical protein
MFNFENFRPVIKCNNVINVNPDPKRHLGPYQNTINAHHIMSDYEITRKYLSRY